MLLKMFPSKLTGNKMEDERGDCILHTTSSTREQQLSVQIHLMSIDQYERGVQFFNCNSLDKARECFEDALMARLVSYGPDSDRVLNAHLYLRLIAHQQSDSCKAAYHNAKITQIHNTNMRRKYQFSSNLIDWSVLADSAE